MRPNYSLAQRAAQVVIPVAVEVSGTRIRIDVRTLGNPAYQCRASHHNRDLVTLSLAKRSKSLLVGSLLENSKFPRQSFVWLSIVILKSGWLVYCCFKHTQHSTFFLKSILQFSRSLFKVCHYYAQHSLSGKIQENNNYHQSFKRVQLAASLIRIVS